MMIYFSPMVTRACLLLSLYSLSVAIVAPVLAGQHSVYEKQGLTVALDIRRLVKSNAGPTEGLSETLRAGDSVSINFKVEDQNGAPLRGLFPAAWIHSSSVAELNSQDICLDKVKAFIGGSLLSRAEIDLNVYYVLTLNEDATITVVDPLFGFGGSKLLAMLRLNGVGFDWALSADQNQLFVSIPATDEIAQIDIATWNVEHHASNGRWQSPGQLLLPDGQPYLWVLTASGVAVFDRQEFSAKAVVKTTETPIALSFSADGKYAFALSQRQLQVIDTHSLTLHKTLELESAASSMAYSSLAKQLYIVHQASGRVSLVDAEQHVVRSVIDTEPGVNRLRFSPDGRWGFMVNPLTDRLSIIDSASGKIVQSGLVASGPEYIAFSDNLAYIRHADSSDLYMVPLDDQDLGKEGAEIPTIDTPGGDSSPGKTGLASGGDGIIQAPGSNAVLVANYHDQAVYFYKEGMAAPMGQFNNYGKSPRSVLAVDHSLRELDSPGQYSTTTRLPKAGWHQAIYFMDSPRVVHCFPFEVKADKQLDAAATSPFNIVAADKNISLTVGQPGVLSFRLESTKIESLQPAPKVHADILLASGLWRQSLEAQVDNKGKLEIKFAPPLAGSYDIYLTPINAQHPTYRKKFSYEAY